jgi:hypothetical protein
MIPEVDWRAHVGGLVAGLVAGFAVDPSRPTAIRRLASAAGLVALLLVAGALVAYRSSQIRSDPSILFPNT